MPLIRAAFRRQTDHAAGAVARSGIDTILRDHRFLHIILIWRIAGLVADADGIAVHQQIVPQVRIAEIDTIRRPGVIRLHFAARIDCRGLEQRQLERIPIEPRRIVRHLGVDRQFLVCGVEFHSGRRGLHSDALLESSGGQRRIYSDVAARLNRNVLLGEFSKACRFDADGVASRIDQVEDIQSRVICRLHGLHAGIDIRQRDGCARNVGACLISD